MEHKAIDAFSAFRDAMHGLIQEHLNAYNIQIEGHPFYRIQNMDISTATSVINSIICDNVLERELIPNFYKIFTSNTFDEAYLESCIRIGVRDELGKQIRMANRYSKVCIEQCSHCKYYGYLEECLSRNKEIRTIKE